MGVCAKYEKWLFFESLNPRLIIKIRHMVKKNPEADLTNYYSDKLKDPPPPPISALKINSMAVFGSSCVQVSRSTRPLQAQS